VALNDGEYNVYVEAVHRLSELGAVVTLVSIGTSQEGFDGEWRMADIFTIKGNLINRLEIFDEADLDAALARFDDLQRPASSLENAATRTWGKLVETHDRRDMDGWLALTAADGRVEDRRKGLRHLAVGMKRQKAMRAFLDVPGSWRLVVDPIAIRGTRLSLTRIHCHDTEEPDQPVTIEILGVVEVDEDGLVRDAVSFDPDDVDAAFEELDARYLAGEAAPYARTWSVMTRTCAVFNRGELPATTPDSVFVDHRPVLAVDAVDLPSYLRAMWDVTPNIRVDIEAVHRLSELGAVLTHAVNETSPEGFNAEWRGILVYTLEADMVNRCEVFDETDLDAALARFDELDRPT
jgi:hypothetical protein